MLLTDQLSRTACFFTLKILLKLRGSSLIFLSNFFQLLAKKKRIPTLSTCVRGTTKFTERKASIRCWKNLLTSPRNELRKARKNFKLK